MTAMSELNRVIDEAEQRGAHPHVMRSLSFDRTSIMDSIAQALSFPSWFGKNLDALYDSLTDLSWLPEGEHVLIWPRSQYFRQHNPEDFAEIYDILLEAQDSVRAESARKLVVEVLDD